MFNIFRGRRLLSIDLGSKDIKIVEVEKYKDKLILLNYIIIQLELEDKLGGILEAPQIFEETLSKIIEEAIKDVKTKDVFFIIPSIYSFFTYFSMPYIPLNTLKSAITYEYKKYLPAAEIDFHIDWRNIEFKPTIQELNPKWFIFFTATPLNFINKLKNIASIAKLKFKGAEIDFFAIEIFFKDIRGSRFFIDLGYSCSNLILIIDGKIAYVQKLKTTGKYILDIFKNLLDVDFMTAENYFKQKGFNIPPEEENIKNALEETINAFSEEIFKIKENLEEKFNTKIENIYFSGGLTLGYGFLDFISKYFSDIPINVFNPLDNIIVDKSIKNLEKGFILTPSIGGCLKYLLS